MKRIFSEMKSLRYALLAFAATALLLGGCSGGGGSSYDAPDTTTSTAPVIGQTQNVLIDAATLKSWVDAGLVNNTASYEKVVILHNSGYATEHIPGAQEWSRSGIDRYDGPVLSGNMVLDGETMDSMLQERGIDENTTIVFTGGNNLARVYFTFRYWGFPKERLKILNGDVAAWKAYGYPVTSVAPSVTPSTFSVKNLPGVRDDLRASLSEAIIGVEGGTVTPYNTYAVTADLTAPKITETLDGTDGGPAGSGGYVIFQGPMYDAVTDNVVAGLKKSVDINGTSVTVFKSAEEMRDFLVNTLGVDLSKPIMTYCRAGNLASQGFAPIDAVLGNEVQVMMYDGSWSQWGSLTNQTGATFVPDASYALPAQLSEWATDGLTVTPYYTVNGLTGTQTVEKPIFRVVDGVLTPDDTNANSIENEDREYYETPAAGGASGPVSGGGGGGC